MRLSRKAIIGLATFGAELLSGALIWALTHDLRKPESSGELYNTESKTMPDALASLPRDYVSIPKSVTLNVPPGVPPLGPPLPGRPRPAHAERRRTAVRTALGVDPVQQKLTQEQEAARTSKLFAAVSVTARPMPPILS